MSKHWVTPSRSSPKPGGNRACLCKNGKYSRKCCDGSLQAQGVGNVTGISSPSPFIIPYYWGLSDSLTSLNEIQNQIYGGMANMVAEYSTNTISITFNATGKYLWVAYPAQNTTKTKWYVTPINQGSIGAPSSNLWSGPNVVPFSFPNYTTELKIHITNYPTTTQGVMELRNV